MTPPEILAHQIQPRVEQVERGAERGGDGWSGGWHGGSPALAQLVQNRGRWAKTTGRSRFPRRGQRLVECAAFVVGEVITFVISH
jgi:hypothetical protein